MTKRLYVYFHKPTGNVLRLTKSKGNKLNDEWAQVQFVKNAEGVQVMRFQFDGATVDVSESGEREVVSSGNTNTN